MRAQAQTAGGITLHAVFAASSGARALLHDVGALPSLQLQDVAPASSVFALSVNDSLRIWDCDLVAPALEIALEDDGYVSSLVLHGLQPGLTKLQVYLFTPEEVVAPVSDAVLIYLGDPRDGSGGGGGTACASEEVGQEVVLVGGCCLDSARRSCLTGVVGTDARTHEHVAIGTEGGQLWPFHWLSLAQEAKGSLPLEAQEQEAEGSLPLEAQTSAHAGSGMGSGMPGGSGSASSVGRGATRARYSAQDNVARVWARLAGIT